MPEQDQRPGEWIGSHFSRTGEYRLTQALIESLPGIFYIIGENGHFLDFNSRFLELTGYFSSEMKAKTAYDLIDHSYHSALERSLDKAWRTGEAVLQAPLRTKSGQLIPFFLTGRRVDTGEDTLLVGMGVDLTNEMDAVRALEEAEHRYLGIFQNSSEGLYLLTRSGTLVDVNPAACSLHRERREKLLEKTIGDLILPEQNRPVELIARAISMGRKLSGNGTGIRSDGSAFEGELSGVPLQMAGQGFYLVSVRDVTARMEVERQMERLRYVVDNTRDIIGITDGDGKHIFLNRAGRDFIGATAERPLESIKISEFHDPAVAQFILEEALPAARSNGVWKGRTSLKNRKGEIIPCSQIIIAHRESNPQVYSTIIRDISERERITEELQAAREWMGITLNSISEGVISVDRAGEIEYMNPAARKLTGWQSDRVQKLAPLEPVTVPLEDQEAIRRTIRQEGLPIQKVLRLKDEESGEPLALDSLNPGVDNSRRQEAILIRKDESEVIVEIATSRMENRQGDWIGTTYIFRNITQHREIARILAHQANHDPLTELINRNRFKVFLDDAIQSARAGKGIHAFAYVDLDQFKVVNDTSGHSAGDQLLRQLSQVMRKLMPPGDVLARLGGDEFGILLHDSSLEAAMDTLNAIKDAVQEFRFVWEDKIFTVGCSIGVVFIDEFAENDTQILRDADTACYAAKELGRQRIHIFHPDDEALTRRRAEMEWVNQVQESLESGDFELYCQPIADLQNGPGHQCEILVRMKSGNNLVAPGMFVPAVERFGLMARLDRFIVKRFFDTVKDFVRSNSDGLQEFNFFTLNLSGATVGDEDFRDFLLQQIKESDIDPDKLCFEITE
ncbi:MAG: PAS domain S-box protein, partial [Leptospiraceae bacterium]|nr:PAS domain S-box protein [Leptospiraceae bacterium]